MRDSIHLPTALVLVGAYLALAAHAGWHIVQTASDARSDGKEAIGYFVAFCLIGFIAVLPLVNLGFAASGLALHPRFLGFLVAVAVLVFTPAAVLLSIACRHATGIAPRIITPVLAICSALLCRMFYR